MERARIAAKNLVKKQEKEIRNQILKQKQLYLEPKNALVVKKKKI